MKKITKKEIHLSWTFVTKQNKNDMRCDVMRCLLCGCGGNKEGSNRSPSVYILVIVKCVIYRVYTEKE